MFFFSFLTMELRIKPNSLSPYWVSFTCSGLCLLEYLAGERGRGRFDERDEFLSSNTEP